ncbi:MFS transporter [Rhodococcus sp. WS4]|nr:MFS transporter [Rhodococcus sp. WS4]
MALAILLEVGKCGLAGAHQPLPSRLGPDGTDRSALRSTEKAARRKLFRKAVLNRTFIMMLLGTIPMYALITVILSWMPAYLESGLGFSRQNSGLLLALPSLAALVLMVFTGTATDRLLVRGVSMRVARGIIPAFALLLAGAFVTLIPWAAGVHTSWAVGRRIHPARAGNHHWRCHLRYWNKPRTRQHQVSRRTDSGNR